MQQHCLQVPAADGRLAQGTAGVVAFSEAEYNRRLEAVGRLCERERLDALVVYGTSANARQGQAQVHYLTGFLGHQESYAVVVPGQRPMLFVQYFNHVPQATRVARADVRWGGPQSSRTVADHLAGLPQLRRLGLVGPVPHQAWQQLQAHRGDRSLVDVTPAFIELRLVKSDEEIAMLRRAAEVTDAALGALVQQAVAGSTELDLQAAASAAAIQAGGQPHFLYLSSTPMDHPDRIVPQQDLTARPLRPGDIVILELSAASTAYSGQVLRTIVIDAEPNELYRRLHTTAWDTFDAIAAAIRPGARAQAVVDAANLIERRGFTICDDVVHGYGGGYLPPVLRTSAQAHGPAPDFVFEPNMTLVIQPNVVAAEVGAGVQVGELVRITNDGIETLHRLPRRLLKGGETLGRSG